MVARNEEKAIQAVNEVLQTCDDDQLTSHNDTMNTHSRQQSNRLFPMECNHACFDSVRKFCDDLKNVLDIESIKEGRSLGIDVLCLNAAVFLGEDTKAQYTKDNIELTMQTNHFSPFLIADQLFDLINPGARVVVTSSGLHAIPTTSFGDFEGAIEKGTQKIIDTFEMIDGSPFDHKQCYAISKLCNVAFCLELNRRLKEKSAIAICFTPGLIPTSGLFRHQKRWHEACLKKQGMNMVETEEWGGVLLAWMAISDRAGSVGGSYWRAPFGVSRRGGKIPDDLFLGPVNEEAEDLTNQIMLWKISAALTGTSHKTCIQ